MWFLVSACLDHRIWLKPGSTVTIGRKGADITLPNRTISRLHATISVATVSESKQSVSTHSYPAVTVTDSGSKYGTYIGTAEQRVNGILELTDGQTIRFGSITDHVLFRLVRENLVVCTSGLKSQMRTNTRAIAAEYDISVTTVFGLECTHLLMNYIQITAKVVQALATARPIISIDFIKAFATVDAMDYKAPDSSKFLPPHDQLPWPNVSFLADERRLALFSGIDFILFSQTELNLVNEIVTASGGKTHIHQFADPSKPSQAEYAALKYTMETTPRFLIVIPKDLHIAALTQPLLGELERMGFIKACITHDQIALAIVYVSVEKAIETPRINTPIKANTATITANADLPEMHIVDNTPLARIKGNFPGNSGQLKTLHSIKAIPKMDSILTPPAPLSAIQYSPSIYSSVAASPSICSQLATGVIETPGSLFQNTPVARNSSTYNIRSKPLQNIFSLGSTVAKQNPNERSVVESANVALPQKEPVHLAQNSRFPASTLSIESVLPSLFSGKVGRPATASGNTPSPVYLQRITKPKSNSTTPVMAVDTPSTTPQAAISQMLSIESIINTGDNAISTVLTKTTPAACNVNDLMDFMFDPAETSTSKQTKNTAMNANSAAKSTDESIVVSQAASSTVLSMPISDFNNSMVSDIPLSNANEMAPCSPTTHSSKVLIQPQPIIAVLPTSPPKKAPTAILVPNKRGTDLVMDLFDDGLSGLAPVKIRKLVKSTQNTEKGLGANEAVEYSLQSQFRQEISQNFGSEHGKVTSFAQRLGMTAHDLCDPSSKTPIEQDMSSLPHMELDVGKKRLPVFTKPNQGTLESTQIKRIKSVDVQSKSFECMTKTATVAEPFQSRSQASKPMVDKYAAPPALSEKGILTIVSDTTRQLKEIKVEQQRLDHDVVITTGRQPHTTPTEELLVIVEFDVARKPPKDAEHEKGRKNTSGISNKMDNTLNGSHRQTESIDKLVNFKRFQSKGKKRVGQDYSTQHGRTILDMYID
ncbi:hypothetical protein QVD99_000406 [Batrachochytrium dendrobatidis]|nr:hypothetical protein QVD99_000406 [Batrachochytrium dendrobatidis]